MGAPEQTPSFGALRGPLRSHRRHYLEGFDFIREIASDDAMRMGSEENYFTFGLSALRYIQDALRLAGREKIERILDLPSGHGRVARMLIAAYPEATVTACDIDRGAVDFCARVLGAEPVYSTEDPDTLTFDEPFDLIWVGSLFTHLDTDAWPGFLRLFERSLESGGLLVFTTHGSFMAEEITSGARRYAINDHESLVRDYLFTGFGFQPYRQFERYGISLTSPSWVCEQIARCPGLDLVTFTEHGWWGRQDVVACQRAPSPA
jgi:cyclopropane fatty-acyl-phospholipid synthase-like methyltransferase